MDWPRSESTRLMLVFPDDVLTSIGVFKKFHRCWYFLASFRPVLVFFVESQLGEFWPELVSSGKIRPILEFSCESQPMLCFPAIFDQCWNFPARFDQYWCFPANLNRFCVFRQVSNRYSCFLASFWLIFEFSGMRSHSWITYIWVVIETFHAILVIKMLKIPHIPLIWTP